jgi:hypothetical protein
MTSLEDQILKKNIPGKCSWWDKDSDEEGEKARAEWFDPDASDPEKEMTELEKQKKWVDADCPEPVRRIIMARQEKVAFKIKIRIAVGFVLPKAALDALPAALYTNRSELGQV